MTKTAKRRLVNKRARRELNGLTSFLFGYVIYQTCNQHNNRLNYMCNTGDSQKPRIINCICSDVGSVFNNM